MSNKFFYGDTDSIHTERKEKVNSMNNNNIIEELAFMDEKLDKILKQQELIMKKLSIMNEDEWISAEGFDFVGDTMSDWFSEVFEKLDDISGIVEKDGE